MAKRKHVRLTEITSKLRIDRFFEACREKHNIYAFQNESKLKVEFLKKMSFPAIVTTKPKKSFFIDNFTLVDGGFEMYFYNFDEELFQKIKAEMISIFKATFFVRFKKEDLRNKNQTTFNGKILIENFKADSAFKN